MTGEAVAGHVLRFLRRNYPTAYTLAEIRCRLFTNPGRADGLLGAVRVGLQEMVLRLRIRDALDSLVESGLVERKAIEEASGGERDYYRLVA